MRTPIRSLFAVAIAVSFLLEACSGGGGTFAPPGLSVSSTPTPPSGAPGDIATQITQGGTIQLPGGSQGAISGFTVGNSLGTAPVRPNGSFSVTAFTGAQFTTVNNASGNPELLALLGPSETTINVHTTAEALVYFSAGLFMLPIDQRQAVYQTLSTAPGFPAVETAVGTALAADPSALVDGNATITSAVRTFLSSISPTSVARTPEQITPKDILVQEPSKLSGVTVLNKQPVQIQFTNEKRRLARAYVDQISVGRSDGTHTQIFDLPISDAVPPVDIPSTNSLKTFTGTLTDIYAGNYAWTPVTTDPITLTPVANSLWTRYDITVVGEGIGIAPGLTSEQQAGLVSMRLQNFVWNFAMPMITGVLLPYNKSPFGGTLSNEDVNAIKGLIDEITTDVPTIYPLVANGSYKDAVIQLIGALANNAPLRNKVIAFVASKVKLDESETKTLTDASSGNAVLKAVDAILTGVDLAATLKDVLTSHPAEIFTVYAVPTKIIVTPPSAVLDNDQMIHFNVSVPSAAGSELSLIYNWQNTANNGHLTALSNKCTVPDNFSCSVGDDVIYHANVSGSGPDTLTLMLQGLDSSGKQQQKIDLGTVTIAVMVTSTPSPTPSPSPDPGSFGTPPTNLPQSRCAGLAVSPHESHIGATISGTVSYAGDAACGGDIPPLQRPTWTWSGQQGQQIISGCTANSLSCVFQGSVTGSAGNRYERLCLNGNSRQGGWISCDYYGVAP